MHALIQTIALFHILSPTVKCPKTFGMIWPSKHQIVINYRFVSRVSEEDSTFLSNLLAMKINSRILGILTRKVHFICVYFLEYIFLVKTEQNDMRYHLYIIQKFGKLF